MKKIKVLRLIPVLVTVIGLLCGCFAKIPADNDATLAPDDITVESTDAFKPVIDDAAYKYGTVHGVTWTWGGKANAADEAAVLREEEENAMYHLDTGNTRKCIDFVLEYSTLAARIAKGDFPTVFTIVGPDASRMIRAGSGRDITACAEAVGINLEDFNPAVLEHFKDEDGGVYGLPFYGLTRCLVVNGALYREAGLVDADGHPIPPKTWDEVIEQAEIIASATGKGGLALPSVNSIQSFINIAYNYGAPLCVWNEQTHMYESEIDTAEAIAALEWYRTACHSSGLVGSPIQDDVRTIQNMFANGECAIILDTFYGVSNLTDNTKSSIKASDIYYFNMPAGPDGHQYNLVDCGAYWFSPSATDEQVIAALEYLMHTGTFSQEWDNDAKGTDVEKWTNNRVKEIAQLVPFPVYNAPWQDQYNDALLETAGGYGELYDFDAQFNSYYDFVQQPGNLFIDESFDLRLLRDVLTDIATDPEADCAALAARADAKYATVLKDYQQLYGIDEPTPDAKQ